METPLAVKAEDALSVSRSGRVRKKSSKLLDSVLMNATEKKPKRSPKTPGRSVGRGRPPSNVVTNRKLQFDSVTPVRSPRTPILSSGNANIQLKPPEDLNPFVNPSPAADSDDEINELVADLVEGVEAESIANIFESPIRQSLYMTEKSNKRKMLKDGKVVTGKMERKDKGKSRYTAYSLWAREFRKTSKFSKKQDLDFSNAAKRLGELWANVSNKEKNAWRRKAKIQATKAKVREKSVPANSVAKVNKIPKHSSRNASNSSTNNNNNSSNNSNNNNSNNISSSSSNAGFLNRATTTRTRKLAEQQKSPTRSEESSPVLTKRGRTNSYKSSNRSSPKSSASVTTTPTTKPATSLSPSSSSHTSSIDDANPKNVVANQNAIVTQLAAAMSPPEIEAIDAAAHLKLLGESLTVIGESLKEHEGQIASSGSLSVLLDSLLCSMGPLLCLTTHIPGLEKKPQLKENLSATLDNIAYVMPGL